MIDFMKAANEVRFTMSSKALIALAQSCARGLMRIARFCGNEPSRIICYALLACNEAVSAYKIFLTLTLSVMLAHCTQQFAV